MRRAARQLGTKDIARIARTYKSRTFGFASRNFYVAFLAALQVDQDPHQYFGEVKLAEPQELVRVKTDAFIKAAGLAEALGVSRSTLRTTASL